MFCTPLVYSGHRHWKWNKRKPDFVSFMLQFLPWALREPTRVERTHTVTGCYRPDHLLHLYDRWLMTVATSMRRITNTAKARFQVIIAYIHEYGQCWHRNAPACVASGSGAYAKICPARHSRCMCVLNQQKLVFACFSFFSFGTKWGLPPTYEGRTQDVARQELEVFMSSACPMRDTSFWAAGLPNECLGMNVSGNVSLSARWTSLQTKRVAFMKRLGLRPVCWGFSFARQEMNRGDITLLPALFFFMNLSSGVLSLLRIIHNPELGFICECGWVSVVLVFSLSCRRDYDIFCSVTKYLYFYKINWPITTWQYMGRICFRNFTKNAAAHGIEP